MQPLVREEVLDELDRDRALSHCGGQALDGGVPHVPGRKHARHAGLEREGRALERPAVVVPELLAREQEPVPVSRYLAGQPVGVRAGTNQHEEGVGGNRLLVAGGALAQHQLLQVGLASPADHRGAGAHLHVGRGLHLSHQVVRHPGSE
jgi:hypothetical protein